MIVDKFDREYRYDLGFAVNGKPLPDPSGFGATENSLDTSAERDARGYLHRAMVATKHTYKLSWRNIDWDMTKRILHLNSIPKPDDAADAIAIALCHARSSTSLLAQVENRKL